MKFFTILLFVLGLAACTPNAPKIEFYGIDLNSSSSSLASVGYLCKDGEAKVRTCTKFDNNSTFLGELVKEVSVDFKDEKIQLIAVGLKDRGATISDLTELQRKLGSAYEVRDSKMNMKISSTLMAHWNEKNGAVIRLIISAGVKGLIPDSVRIIFYPSYAVRGDM